MSGTTCHCESQAAAGRVVGAAKQSRSHRGTNIPSRLTCYVSRVLPLLAFVLALVLLDAPVAAAAPLAHGVGNEADELVMFGIILAGLGAVFFINRFRK